MTAPSSRTGVSPDRGGSPLPLALLVNPRLSRWLGCTAEGTVEVRSGKVELGQGVLTALAQIAADELEVDPARITMLPATTGTSPDEAYTSGSLSIQDSGPALRQACAQARALLLAAAAQRLGVPADRLVVDDGRIRAPGGPATSYWELAGAGLLERDAGPPVPERPVRGYRVVGRRLDRFDLPDKVTGRPRFIHDLRLPGMLHGRVVRPADRGSTLTTAGTARAAALAGVAAIVRDGSFLGVLAEREETAVRAAELLRADSVWHHEPGLPDQDRLAEHLRAAPAETVTVDRRGPRPPGPAAPVGRHRAAYSRPYLAHASMAPSCGIARWTAEPSDVDPSSDVELQVWSHSQGVYQLRRELGRALGVAPERIVVRHAEGAGCYGHNGAEDAAFDAVLLARAVPGRPVRVVWSRPDELGWAPFGAAMVADLSAELDAVGDVLSWRHEVWSNGHVGRPGALPVPALLAGEQLAGGRRLPASADPPAARGGGSDRNAVPLYDFPEHEVIKHRVLDMPLRTSSLRSLGGYLNVFAIESFIDELARLAGADPVDYRLRHLPDERARAVLETVAARSGWSDRNRTADPDGDGNGGGDGGGEVGHGVAFARYKNTGAYCAVVARVRAGHQVRVTDLVLAVDVGLVVNPDGVVNQIEGGAIQSTSWTLKEQVRFDRSGVRSTDWESYPILRFSEVPRVRVHLLDRPGLPSLGAGEAAQGPVAAAIANATADATGIRVRDLPLTPEHVLAAMP